MMNYTSILSIIKEVPLFADLTNFIFLDGG